MPAQRNGNGSLLNPLPVFMPNSQDPREAMPGSTPIWNGQPSSVQAAGGNEATSFATMTPQQYLQYLQQLAESPTGQAAQRAQNQTSAMNIKTALAQIEQGRRQLETSAGTQRANAWAQQQQVRLAQQAHELAVLTQQQSNEIQQGQLTGTFNGQPTLPAIAQQATLTGQINGQPTEAVRQFNTTSSGFDPQGNPTQSMQNQRQQFGLNQGALTGLYEGQQTLPAQQLQQQSAQNWAGILGYDPRSGMPTLANQQFVTGASGYLPNGQATLPREQAAAGTALQAGQLAASLQGPGNWARFLQAQNGIAGSAASNLVASAPGGLGAASGPNPAPMTLASVLGSWGVAPSQGSSQGGAPNYQMPGGPINMPTGVGNINPNAPQNVYAGGSPNFNELTGQYMQQGGASGRGNDADVMSGGQAFQNEGGQAAGGWNPMSPTGAIGQVMSAARVTNAQFGLSDQEAGTLQNAFNNPGQMAGTWWSSKSPDQKSYLSGLNSYWGGSPDTFAYKERNSRPTQGYAGMA